MAQSPVIRIIRLRFGRLQKQGSGMALFNEDAIHDFRVEYKKLRAFLRLLAAGVGGEISIPGRLKQVYRKAGTVRDLQLHKKFIERNGGRGRLTVYTRRLRQRLTLAKKELGQVMQPASLAKAKENLERRLPDALPRQAIQRLVSAKTDDIKEILSGKSLRDNDLHTIRKAIKDIIYNEKIVTKELKQPITSSGWTKSKAAMFNSLADTLGAFQDSSTLLRYFKEGNHPALPSIEKKQLEDLRQIENQKKLEAKRSLKDELLKFFPVK